MNEKKHTRQDQNAIEDQFQKIAQTILDIPTLEYRNLDELDFHELSVGQIKDALWAAYAFGRSTKK